MHIAVEHVRRHYDVGNNQYSKDSSPPHGEDLDETHETYTKEELLSLLTEFIPTREGIRKKGPYDHSTWTDGCEVTAHCLDCPLRACRFDTPKYYKRWKLDKPSATWALDVL